MTDKRLRKLLMTIRAALIMAAKAIDLFLSDDIEAPAICDVDNVTSP